MEVLVAATDPRQVRVLKMIQQLKQRVRPRHTVRVDEPDQRVGGGAPTQIPRRPGATAWSGNERHRILRNDGRRGVGRAVVDKQNLAESRALVLEQRHNRVQAGANRAAAVASGDDETDRFGIRL